MINRQKQKWLLIGGMVVALLPALFLAFAPFPRNTAAVKSDLACGVVLPKPRCWTNDFASIFLPAQLSTLDSIISQHEQKSGDEIAVVTIEESMLGGCQLEEYTLTLARSWRKK